VTNPYLNTHEECEQDLLEDLVDECIHVTGEKLYYIPRKLSESDGINIFNEDRTSIFQNAYPFTGYIENAQSGLEGNGYLMQKFGAVVDYNVTITVGRREWNKRVGFHGTTIIPDSPCSGDLIYWPVTDQLFEIKFVDDKQNPFAQLGAFYTYRLTVELMQYSSQQINTGHDEIDKFETLKTLDTNADVSLWGGVVKFDIVKPGKGYIGQPEIVMKSLTGSGAQFWVDLDEETGAVNDVVVLDPGQAYHSMDRAEIHGECEEPAEVVPVIRTVTENTGDAFGTNAPNIKKAMEISDVSPKTTPFGPPEYPTTLEDVFGMYHHDENCPMKQFELPPENDVDDENKNPENANDDNFGLNSF